MDTLYRHYKGMFYRAQGISLHSETLEPLVRYQCLYKNDLGTFWVRPQKMFEETVTVAGHRTPRFAKVKVTITTVSQPTKKVSDELLKLAQSIFLDTNEEKFLNKVLSSNYLCVLAYADQKLVGFKIGKVQSPEIFYSWLGGVDKDFRRLGIAQDLLDHLIEKAAELGCKKIQTKSMSIWPEMMVLNLKNGFEIIKKVSSERGEKFLLEKVI